MLKTLTLTMNSLADTVLLGKLLADVIPDGTTIGLTGTLGAGKTFLIQAIATACGVLEGSATSPTYVLCNTYRGDRLIYHIDAYRLADSDEFLELGVEEMFESSGLTLIEWADRVSELLPDERISIDLQVTAPEERLATIKATRLYEPLLSQIGQAWPA